jgi:hypothetical protein
MFVNSAHQTYLYIQLGITALNDAHHDEAVSYFTAATCSSALSSAGAIDSIYKDFVVVSRCDPSEHIFVLNCVILCSSSDGT